LAVKVSAYFTTIPIILGVPYVLRDVTNQQPLVVVVVVIEERFSIPQSYALVALPELRLQVPWLGVMFQVLWLALIFLVL
jgi:hypothetical protein